MKRKDIIYLVGLPGTGKTFFRQMCLYFPNICVISSDDVIEQEARENHRNYNWVLKNSNFRKIYQELQQKVDRAVENGQTIVVDMTNLTINARKRWCVPKEYRRIAIVFEADDQTKERLRLRNLISDKQISKDVYERMEDVYQPVNQFCNENFNNVYYRKDYSINEWSIICTEFWGNNGI